MTSLLDQLRAQRPVHRNDFKKIDSSVAFPKLLQVTLPERRYYEDDEGFQYESVTSFLGRLSDDSALVAWRKRVGEEEAASISKAATVRGNGVHQLAEDYLNNLGLEASPDVSNLSRNMFLGIIKYINNIDNIRGIECQLASRGLRLAGTSDCIADYKCRSAVIDFKTSKKEKLDKWIDDYFTQGCIYALMYAELTGILVDDIVIIIATETGVGQEFIRTTKSCLPLVRNYLEQDKNTK